MAAKHAAVTRIMDSMTDNLRPTRAKATDVANAVLHGVTPFSLVLRLFMVYIHLRLFQQWAEFVMSIQCLPIVLLAEEVFNQDLYYKRTVKYVGEPMTRFESIASSAVQAAIKGISHNLFHLFWTGYKAHCQVQAQHACSACCYSSSKDKPTEVQFHRCF